MCNHPNTLKKNVGLIYASKKYSNIYLHLVNVLCECIWFIYKPFSKKNIIIIINHNNIYKTDIIIIFLFFFTND